jgi:translation initiation factor IF-2
VAPVATVLIDNGTLHAGENFVVGNIFGKVRAMFDDRGRALDEAGPSTPVEILGLEGRFRRPATSSWRWPSAKRLKRASPHYREAKTREAALAKSARVSLEGLSAQIKNEGTKQLDIILKGDVQGSVEVHPRPRSPSISGDQVRMKVLRHSVGAITESDVLLAAASNTIIIGFNVRPERKAQEIAESGEGRYPSALDHLRAAGRDEEGDDRAARSDHQGVLPGTRRGARQVFKHSQGRHHCRLPGAATASSSAIPKCA